MSTTPLAADLLPAALEALISEYEGKGWIVRMRDTHEQRVIVRTTGPNTANGASTANDPETLPAGPAICRKLWVDKLGKLQDTPVPC